MKFVSITFHHQLRDLMEKAKGFLLLLIFRSS